MERESNPMQAQCRSGCGFYGSPATDGLCSICYKEALKKKQQPPNVSPPSSTTSSVVVSGGGGFTTSSVGSYANANTTALTIPAGGGGGGTGAAGAGAAANSLIDTAVPTIPIISPSNNTATVSANTSTSASTPIDKTGESGADGLMSGACNASVLATASDASDDDPKDGDKDSGKKKKNRCATCRKKVGLTGFECRCGGLFCSVHRYSDKHDCHFDYRLLGATEIRRNNPVVVGEKIKKI